MNMLVRDAQQVALSFLIRQATLIEPTVYQIRYQDIQYPALIPVDTTAPDWIQSVTYFSMDGSARRNGSTAMRRTSRRSK
jgi:hypothetical protein